MRGLAQREFSALLDIDQYDLAAFEAGAKRINANLLFRIAKALEVRPVYFFRVTSRKPQRLELKAFASPVKNPEAP
jgi:transcriptional regulator with XRE-family HTH domain